MVVGHWTIRTKVTASLVPMLLLRRAGVELDRDVICRAEAGKEEILPSLVQFL